MRTKLLTAKQVSEMTGTARRTIYDWNNDPAHPFPKAISIGPGGDALRWHAHEVERFIAERTRQRDRVVSIRQATIRGDRAV
jgi:predicted DNA-binding transcriptional regulator AlpA